MPLGARPVGLVQPSGTPGERRACNYDDVASGSRPDRAERREYFLDITARLVQTEGLAMVTMERVAALAGLSKPVIYSHFADRGELLRSLLERCWRSVDQSVQVRLRTARTFDECLEALVVGYFDEIAAQGALVRLMIGNASQEPAVEQARRARQRAAEVEWSEFYQRRAGLPPNVADACAAILRSALQGASEYWIDRPGTTPDDAIDTCLQIMRAGVARLRRRAQVRSREQPEVRARRPRVRPPT
jgi:AcrR family transcriptional regulator